MIKCKECGNTEIEAMAFFVFKAHDEPPVTKVSIYCAHCLHKGEIEIKGEF